MEAQQCVQLTDTNRSRAWSRKETRKKVFWTIWNETKSITKKKIYDFYGPLKRMRKAEFERSFKKKRKQAGSTKRICCVVVSLRERRLRKQKKSATARLLKGKTTNKGRARIYALYIWIRYIPSVSSCDESCEEEREKNGKTYFDITIAVIMAERIHLFPFRTQKLSFLTPKVLSGPPLGRIGHRRFSVEQPWFRNEIGVVFCILGYFDNEVVFLLWSQSLFSCFSCLPEKNPSADCGRGK